VEKLVRAVQMRTVSFSDAEKIDYREFRKFQQFTEEAFPDLCGVCTVTSLNDMALLLVWEGKDPKKKPTGFVAHYDVVPAENDHLWNHPPFNGVIEDGYVWGRGTLDLKGFLIALLEAGNQLAKEGFVPHRSIYFLLGGDEETAGLHGAGRISALLKEKGVFFDALYDEGSIVASGMIPGVRKPAAVVGIAEKGQLTVLLKARGADGHAARPPKGTAIGVLSRAVAKIERNPFPLRLTPSVYQFVSCLAPLQAGIKRFLLSNIGLFKNFVMKQLARDSDLAALLRTTQAPTVIRGGDADNVLPLHAEALINCRLLPGDTVAGVLQRYRRLLKGMDVEVSVAPGTRSTEAIPASDCNSRGFRNLSAALLSTYPDAVILPYIVTVATDSKHYTDIAGGIFRIMPFLIDSDELSRIHGINERISVDNLHRGISHFKALLQGGDDNER